MTMNLLFKLFALAAICFSVTNCITVTKVEKFTGKEKGIRYSLPSTYLLVTPKSDGTASYEWVYLPDPDNEYAVRTISFMSKYTTDLTLDNNLLKKVTAKSDTTGVANKMFDAAQNIYTARTAAASEAAKKEADKNAAAQKAIADAEIAYEEALAEYNLSQNNSLVSPAQLLALKIKVAQARIKLNAAKAAASRSLSAMNVPEGREQGTSQAWGPVLFRVVQTADDVKLVAVTVQQRFDTTSVVTPSTPPQKQSFHFDGPNVFDANPNGSLQFKVVADREMYSAETKGLTITRNNFPYDGSKVTLTLQPDKKKIIVDLFPGPPQGEYVMYIPYTTKPDEKPIADASIFFTVR